ncbi:MAG: response regulator transcription factor, partial [Candidatus Acidiferrales bacterium]
PDTGEWVWHPMARILITDDHAEARRGVRRLLEGHPGWEVCGEAENALEAIEKAAALKPDLVILDLSMPKMSGLEAGRIIHRAAPQLPLLMFSLYAGDPQMMAEFRDAGFSGDVNKATANLLSEAVETLLRGGTYFQSSAVPRAILAEGAASGSRAAEAPSVAARVSSSAPAATAAPNTSANAAADSSGVSSGDSSGDATSGNPPLIGSDGGPQNS